MEVAEAEEGEAVAVVARAPCGDSDRDARGAAPTISRNGLRRKLVGAVGEGGGVQAADDAVVAPRRTYCVHFATPSIENSTRSMLPDETITSQVTLPEIWPYQHGSDSEASTGTRRKREDEEDRDEHEMKREALSVAVD